MHPVYITHPSRQNWLIWHWIPVDELGELTCIIVSQWNSRPRGFGPGNTRELSPRFQPVIHVYFKRQNTRVFNHCIGYHFVYRVKLSIIGLQAGSQISIADVTTSNVSVYICLLTECCHSVMSNHPDMLCVCLFVWLILLTRSQTCFITWYMTRKVSLEFLGTEIKISKKR